jgi:hypothetical protein
LHGAQPTTQPFTRGGAVGHILWPEGRGEDAIVEVGEGPNGGFGSRSGGKGAKFVAWVEELSYRTFEEEAVAYG